MPLKQTVYGGECPLGKFQIDIPAGAGCYDRDPGEECLKCNFSDFSSKEFDLEKICKCPSYITWSEYKKLREQYASTGQNLTKKGFLEFVQKNYEPRSHQKINS